MITRRKFIKQAAIAGVSFTILPRHVLGGKGYIAPSDTLYIGAIGAGGKGESDIAEMAKSPHVKIISFADVDDRATITTRKNFPQAKAYRDFRKMLDTEKSIDACTISTPDHTHAVCAMAAMARGKHVYVQKPLTHNIFEARMLTQAARRYKVVTQMGNQMASGEDVRKTKEMYNAGLIGEAKKIIAWTNRPVWPQGLPTPQGKYDIPSELDWDLWVGPASMIEYNAAYLPFNWRGWWNFGTGALGDMACHILDPVFRILPINYPNSVECSTATIWKGFFQEANYNDSCPSASIVHLNFPRTDGKGDIKLTWMDGGILPERPDELLPHEPMGEWDGGLIIEGTKGKIMSGCYSSNPVLLPLSRMKTEQLPTPTIARVPEGHYLQWVNACLKGFGKSELSSPFDYSGPFTEAILIGNLALRSYALSGGPDGNSKPGRKKLLWDAKNMKITNFDEANAFVKREYREGWSI